MQQRQRLVPRWRRRSMLAALSARVENARSTAAKPSGHVRSSRTFIRFQTTKTTMATEWPLHSPRQQTVSCLLLAFAVALMTTCYPLASGEAAAVMTDQLRDVKALVGQVFVYKISDAVLPLAERLQVTEAESDHLPKWLYYSDHARTLSGVPMDDDTGVYVISVRSWDAGNDDARFYTLFAIIVMAEDLVTREALTATRSLDQIELSRSVCSREGQLMLATVVIDADAAALTADNRVHIARTVANTLGFKHRMDDGSSGDRAAYRHSQLHDLRLALAKGDELTFRKGRRSPASLIVAGQGNVPSGRSLPGVAVSWTVGCRSISDSSLKVIERLEASAKDGTLAQELSFDVIGWSVTSFQTAKDPLDSSFDSSRRRHRRLAVKAMETLDPYFYLQPPTAVPGLAPPSSAGAVKETLVAADLIRPVPLIHPTASFGGGAYPGIVVPVDVRPTTVATSPPPSRATEMPDIFITRPPSPPPPHEREFKLASSSSPATAKSTLPVLSAIASLKAVDQPVTELVSDDELSTCQFTSGSSNISHHAKQTQSADHFVQNWREQIMKRNSNIRLRGDRRNGIPSHGRVEVFIRGKWGIVCDDNWNNNSANVACRMLGYSRGASRATINSEFGVRGLTSNDFVMANVRCGGQETSLLQCSYQTQHECHINDVAGVECIPDSACPSGSVAWVGSCYQYFHEPRHYHSAQSTCQRIRGHLALQDVEDYASFLGDMLLSLNNVSSIVLVHGPSASGSESSLIGQIYSEDGPDCLALATNSTFDTKKKNTDVYQLRSVNCNDPLPFICVSAYKVKDCFDRNGVSYVGYASSTLIGTICHKWSLKRDLLHMERDKVWLPRKEEREHNFCRNPDGDIRPWCWVNAAQRIFGYCDIPRCNTLGAAGQEETLQSKGFLCKLTHHWIPSIAHCNGHIDCPDEEDEQNCSMVLTNNFRRAINSRIDEDATVIYRNGSLERCATFCNKARFSCKSFVYRKSEHMCFLYTDYGTPQNVIFDNDHDTYFAGVVSPLCTGKYRCINNMCIKFNDVCNGFDDCGDYSDEASCAKRTGDFEVMLSPLDIQYGREHSGMVMVKLKNVWNYICDDNWELADAQVVCRQLGYSDALRVLKRLIAPTNQLISEVHCNGSENSLEMCLPPKLYTINPCSYNEAAGVICKVNTECRADMFACHFNKKCLTPRLVCDTFNDCGDNSDEMNCTEVQIGLVDGLSNNSGRVVIVLNGLRGSLCGIDLDQTTANVICRSLGFRGNAKVSAKGLHSTFYGPIWLDNLRCNGEEHNILDCQHSPWGVHQCDYGHLVWIDCITDTGDINSWVSNISGERTITMQFPKNSSNVEKQAAAGLMELWIAETCTQSYWRNSTHDHVMRNIYRSRHRRITGGNNSTLSESPMLVSIHIDGTHKCGGILLNDKWILSAAHCFSYTSRMRFKVVVGTDTIIRCERSAKIYRVEKIIVHHLFVPYSNNDYDFALLKILKSKGSYISFSHRTKPACLPKSELDYLPPQLRCFIVGWGITHEGRKSHRLMKATVGLFDDITCSTYYKNETTPRMICAGWNEGVVDTCGGDSGGPLICPIDGYPVVVGITSYGRGCGQPKSPGVYSKIASVLPWIYDNVSSQN